MSDSKKDIGWDYLFSNDSSNTNSELHKYRDGSGSYNDVDGNEGYTYSDGSAFYRGSDGSEGRRYTDGSGSYSGADGSEGLVYSDGSGYYRDSSGNTHYFSSDEERPSSVSTKSNPLSDGLTIAGTILSLAVARADQKQREQELHRRKMMRNLWNAYMDDCEPITFLILLAIYSLLLFVETFLYKFFVFAGVASAEQVIQELDMYLHIEAPSVFLQSLYWFKWQWCVIIFITLIYIIVISIIAKKTTQAKMRLAKFEPNDVIGLHYNKVATIISNYGFTNIELRPLKDVEPGTEDIDQSVSKVAIRGKTNFTRYTTFPYDSHIDLWYHSKKEIAPPRSPNSCKNKRRIIIVSEFKQAGFTRIIERPTPLKHSGLWAKDEGVKEVLINNSAEFDTSSLYPYDTPVIIYYYSKYRVEAESL